MRSRRKKERAEAKDAPKKNLKRRQGHNAVHDLFASQSLFKIDPDSGDEFKSDQFKSDQFKSDQFKSDQFKSDQFKSDQFKSDQFKSDQFKSDQFKSDQFKSDQFKSDQFKSDQFKSDQFKSDQFKSDQFKSDQFKSDQVVMKIDPDSGDEFKSDQFKSDQSLSEGSRGSFSDEKVSVENFSNASSSSACFVKEDLIKRNQVRSCFSFYKNPQNCKQEDGLPSYLSERRIAIDDCVEDCPSTQDVICGIYTSECDSQFIIPEGRDVPLDLTPPPHNTSSYNNGDSPVKTNKILKSPLLFENSDSCDDGSEFIDVEEGIEMKNNLQSNQFESSHETVSDKECSEELQIESSLPNILENDAQNIIDSSCVSWTEGLRVDKYEIAEDDNSKKKSRTRLNKYEIVEDDNSEKRSRTRLNKYEIAEDDNSEKRSRTRIDKYEIAEDNNSEKRSRTRLASQTKCLRNLEDEFPSSPLHFESSESSHLGDTPSLQSFSPVLGSKKNYVVDSPEGCTMLNKIPTSLNVFHDKNLLSPPSLQQMRSANVGVEEGEPRGGEEFKSEECEDQIADVVKKRSGRRRAACVVSNSVSNSDVEVVMSEGGMFEKFFDDNKEKPSTEDNGLDIRKDLPCHNTRRKRQILTSSSSSSSLPQSASVLSIKNKSSEKPDTPKKKRRGLSKSKSLKSKSLKNAKNVSSKQIKLTSLVRSQAFGNIIATGKCKELGKRLDNMLSDNMDSDDDLPDITSSNESVKSSQSESVKSLQSESVKSLQSESVKSPQSESVKSPQSESVKSPQSESVKSPQSESVKSPQSESVKSSQSESVKSSQSASLPSSEGQINIDERNLLNFDLSQEQITSPSQEKENLVKKKSIVAKKLISKSRSNKTESDSLYSVRNDMIPDNVVSQYFSETAVAKPSSKLLKFPKPKPRVQKQKRKCPEGNQSLLSSWISNSNTNSKNRKSEKDRHPSPLKSPKTPPRRRLCSSPAKTPDKVSPSKSPSKKVTPKKVTPKKVTPKKVTPKKVTPKKVTKLKSIDESPKKSPEKVPPKRTPKKTTKETSSPKKSPKMKKPKPVASIKINNKKNSSTTTHSKKKKSAKKSPAKPSSSKFDELPQSDDLESEDFNYSIDSWGNTVPSTRNEGNNTVIVDDNSTLDFSQDQCKYRFFLENKVPQKKKKKNIVSQVPQKKKKIIVSQVPQKKKVSCHKSLKKKKKSIVSQVPQKKKKYHVTSPSKKKKSIMSQVPQKKKVSCHKSLKKERKKKYHVTSPSKKKKKKVSCQSL